MRMCKEDEDNTKRDGLEDQPKEQVTEDQPKEEGSNQDNAEAIKLKSDRKMGSRELLICIICLAVVTVVGFAIKGFNSEPKALTEGIMDVKEVTNRIMEVKNNGYVKYSISDTDSFTVLYNKENEAVLSTPNGISVYMGHKVLVPNGSEFKEIMELTPVGYMELIVSSVLNDNLGTYDGELSDNTQGTPITKYTFNIEGIDNLRKMYSRVEPNFNKDILDKYEDEGKTVALRLEVYLDENNGLGGVYSLVLDGVDYTVWLFDGYSDLGDWSLPKEVYTENADYHKIFNEVVLMLNHKVLYGDIVYQYKNATGDVDSSNLDTKVNSLEAYNNLGTELQDSAMLDFIKFVTSIGYKYALSGEDLGYTEFKSRVVDYLKNNELQGEMTLLELYTEVALSTHTIIYVIPEATAEVSTEVTTQQ